MDPLRETYRQEADELLADLETALLELEERPGDGELVGRAFRALHTIKGSGAMCGYDDVAAFTHQIENAFDRVRSGQVAVTPGLVTASLGAKDHIRALLWEEAGPTAGEPLLAEIRRLTEPAADPQRPPRGRAAAGAAPSAAPPRPARQAGATGVYRIRFRPHPSLFAGGTDPARLLAELRGLGPCRVVADTDRIPPLEAIDPEACYTQWDLVLTTDRGFDAVRDVFIFVEGESEVTIEEVAGKEDGAEPRRLGQILAARGDATPEAIEAALTGQRRLGQILEETGIVKHRQVQAALAEQQAVNEVRQRREAAETEASIRVPAAKLDTLVDLVGELVIAQARLSELAARRDDPDLLSVTETLERLSTELRDNALNIRMLPIGTTFGRFRRLVRDLSSELGKQVELVTEGAETELDKTVIERLGDPLVHLIRNAIDHGLEAPEERERAAKPRVGTVRLSAYHSGPNVFIAISDDGRGLNAQAIRAKAVERGLLGADDSPSEKELFDLVFAPGFSTAKKVTGVSGRGVGMDVVKRSITALRGSVELGSSPGGGTTVRIRLPLTLAIIEGLLVQVGEERFVLPLVLVEECIELTPGDRQRAHGRQTAEVRGHLVPYVRLREWFGIDGRAPEIEQVVVANLDGERFGFAVDHVVGQHQTVIKTLGRVYQGIEGLSGSTILGDGAVALILDPPKILAARLADRSG